MDSIQIFNFYYFFYIVLGIFITWIIIKIVDQKSNELKRKFILSLIIINFLIHFLKIFVYPYTLVEQVWTKVTFENISASTILLFPFFYITNNKTIKDYMIIIGLFAGIIPFLYPADAISTVFNGTINIGTRPAFMLENIRFYVAHYFMFLVSFLLLRYRIHTVSFKRAHKISLIFVCILILVFINELLVTLLGGSPVEHFLDPSKRNPSFIFGVKDGFDGLGKLFGILVPKFMETNHPLYGFTYFIPVLWLIIPIFVYGNLIVILFYLIVDYKNISDYLHQIKKQANKTQT
ncbi:MAG: hypothetical protein A2Y45_08845 [Tenericutes bacterium GWC2_34_14]|nr:MAG: hypothetical protein A2Y45_08845 [Tenericutes bacterium GWC2_34_14]OHE34977.1 MAG: hypothetical protein A2012_02455 [Tenericutes bacterium GWE2_34_108]OHE37163.1 MAG: hypothetical protein A2Y46_00555 [Tenericutes bacterium GWF1_35_14]OHE39705.1 MAG: hypothetical protein A2Y44_02305 [Tenericutes bacterium GWF2_35_184]OHE44107.1 MAG: hypothetical protein A2221_03205 [Tenericutes bacterium RIFOXYA2_FULL_36_32]OHE44643.1 MAG: hypothetical protein A3K26_05370 [Tenericutes bacterium RIFOXYA1